MSKVSVIIPTYNRCLTLLEAVESVLDQDFCNFEIIIIDDGSKDATKVYVNQLMKLTSKVKYIYQENHGRSHARNVGIQAAAGEYISFLDSDDKYLPQKLGRQVEILDENPEYGLSFSNYYVMNEKGNILSGVEVPSIMLTGSIYPDLLYFKGTIITTPGVMVRSKILAEVGGFDEGMQICEDLDLWRRIAKQTKVYQLIEPLIYIRYRMNEPINWWEYLRGRKFYYQKAIADDPQMPKAFIRSLYSEMYLQYGIDGLRKRNYRFAIYSLLNYLWINPIEAMKKIVKRTFQHHR